MIADIFWYARKKHVIVVQAVEKGASEEPRDDWCLESNALKNVTTKLLCHFSRRIKISDNILVSTASSW